jgi:S-formylglutathione hydrolase
MKLLKSHKSFEGQTQFWEHASSSTQTNMKFSVYLPPGEIKGALIWLSGLTCNEENFITKAGAQKSLAAHSLMIICPDTSPRGLNLPKEHDSWEFGEAAGFYLNALTPHYCYHYRMYDYVAVDIYDILLNHFGVEKDSVSLMGHSMGGHGALVIGLREVGKFKSISAFAPISNPVQGYWREKVIRGYLGDDRQVWADYDACELLKKGIRHPHTILIDQGLDDVFFLEKKLMTDHFAEVATQAEQLLDVRWRPGYDHGYYFIATFIESHIDFHAKALEI